MHTPPALPEQFSKELKLLHHSGISLDEAYSQLRSKGATPHQCIVAVMEEIGCDFAVAKGSVLGSKTWHIGDGVVVTTWDELRAKVQQCEVKKLSTTSSKEIDWTTFSYDKLEATYDSYSNDLSKYDPKIAKRLELITRFITSDRIVPPIDAIQSKFTPALCEVFSRLPPKDFQVAVTQFSIVLQNPEVLECLAINFQRPRSAPSSRANLFTIIFFHFCWKLSAKALVGLIAHEFAHSFVTGYEFDYLGDEMATDAKACDWGFQNELLCLSREKEVLFPESIR